MSDDDASSELGEEFYRNLREKLKKLALLNIPDEPIIETSDGKADEEASAIEDRSYDQIEIDRKEAEPPKKRGPYKKQVKA